MQMIRLVTSNEYQVARIWHCGEPLTLANCKCSALRVSIHSGSLLLGWLTDDRNPSRTPLNVNFFILHLIHFTFQHLKKKKPPHLNSREKKTMSRCLWTTVQWWWRSHYRSGCVSAPEPHAPSQWKTPPPRCTTQETVLVPVFFNNTLFPIEPVRYISVVNWINLSRTTARDDHYSQSLTRDWRPHASDTHTHTHTHSSATAHVHTT